MKETDPTTILHISDLHFGSDFDERRVGVDSLLDSLVRDLKEVNKRPDCLVVSGDLTTQGEPGGHADALKFLVDLTSELGLARKDVVIVPGNHEIDWKEIKRCQDAGCPVDELRAAAFRSYQNNLFNKFYGLDRLDTASWFTTHWSDKRVFVLGLNSCMIDGPDHQGVGYVDPNQMGDALKMFGNKWRDCSTRIAVVHHHLVPVTWMEANPDLNPPSLTINTQRVLDWLVKNSFHAVLHGHQHQPFCAAEVRFDKYKGSDPTRFARSEIVLLGAGTIGANRSRLNNIGRNHYQLLSITQGQIELHSRVSAGNVFTEFEYHQRLSIPLRPGLNSPQLCRVVAHLETQTNSKLLGALGRDGVGTSVGFPRHSLPSLYPSILAAASNKYIGTSMLPNSPPGADTDAPEFGSSYEQMDSHFRQLFIVPAEELKKPEVQKFLLNQSSKDLKVGTISDVTYSSIARTAMGEVVDTLSSLYRPFPGDESLLKALKSDPTRLMLAVFGEKDDRFVGLIIDPSEDTGEAEATSNNDQDPFVVLSFEPPPKFLSLVHGLLEQAWNSASLL